MGEWPTLCLLVLRLLGYFLKARPSFLRVQASRQLNAILFEQVFQRHDIITIFLEIQCFSG